MSFTSTAAVMNAKALRRCWRHVSITVSIVSAKRLPAALCVIAQRPVSSVPFHRDLLRHVASQAEVTTAMDIVVSAIIVVGLAIIVLMLIGRPPPPTRRFSKYTGEPDEEFKREFERDRAFLASFIKMQEIERELETGLRPKQFGLAGLLLLVTAVAIVLSIWKWVSFR
jgi:hypothetical protein